MDAKQQLAIVDCQKKVQSSVDSLIAALCDIPQAQTTLLDIKSHADAILQNLGALSQMAVLTPES